MTRNVAGVRGLTTNNGKREICLPKQTVLATVQDREHQRARDRGFYPFIDLSSFMQPFITAQ